MPDRSSTPHYRVSIDRVVVDGTPDDLQPDVFRRKVAAEVERLLVESGATEHIRTSLSQKRVVHRPEQEVGADPTHVARQIVRTLH